MTELTLFPRAVLRTAGLPWSLLEPMNAEGDHAVEQADAAMAELCATERFQRAVALSHPDALRNAVLPLAEGASRHRRKRLRTAAAMTQRLATKNDTANGYGPMDVVELGGLADLCQPAASADRCARQAGLVSAWVVERLAATIGKDLAPALPDRLAVAIQLTAEGVSAGGRGIRLPAAEREALRRIGTLDGPDPALHRLRAAGLVEQRPDIAPATTDPLRRLADELARIPAAKTWVGELMSLRELAQRVADAPWRAQGVLTGLLRARIEALTGPLPPRPAARFYTDREVLYQEGRGADGVYRVGGGLLHRITEGLLPVARLAACYGYAQFLDYSNALRTMTGDGEIGLVALMTAVAERPNWTEGMATPHTDEVLARLDRLWHNRTTVEPELLAGALDGLPVSDLAMLSPDVMLTDRHEIIVGELHAGLHTFGLFEHFWPDGADAAWAAEHTGLADTYAQIVAPRSQGKAFVPELPVRSIEFRSRATRPDPVPLGAVRVRWAAALPWLLMPDGQQRLLVPNDQSNPLVRALSPAMALLPPPAGKAHTPRLHAGQVIAQRARWRLDAPHLDRRDRTVQYGQLRDWQRANHLPDQVFVRRPGAPKPFFTDFRNPLLADVFAHWVPAATPVELSEALPAGDQLWLRRGNELFTAELRISALWGVNR